jgi:hypothetical protein
MQPIQEQAVVDVPDSTTVGADQSHLEFLAAAGDLGQNPCRVLLGCELLHAADLKLEVGPHETEHKHGARCATTAPVKPCDNTVSVALG